MCSINHFERIEKLKQETRDLRKEVENLKGYLLRQIELIINLLSKQTGILAETKEKICEFSWRFPLKDLKDLKQFEDEINDENENQIINVVQPLLASKSISRSISNVLCENLIISKLLDFPKTIDILFEAWRRENIESDSQTFLSELRKAIRIVKKGQKLSEQTGHVQKNHTGEELITKTD